MISDRVRDLFIEQVGHELSAHQAYYGISLYFEGQSLKKWARITAALRSFSGSSKSRSRKSARCAICSASSIAGSTSLLPSRCSTGRRSRERALVAPACPRYQLATSPDRSRASAARRPRASGVWRA